MLKNFIILFVIANFIEISEVNAVNQRFKKKEFSALSWFVRFSWKIVATYSLSFVLWKLFFCPCLLSALGLISVTLKDKLGGIKK